MTTMSQPTDHACVPSRLRAFSLIEMMIAIVILGLGLVMTATMFPVAWTRARTLTEYTTQRVIADSAAALIGESLRPSGTTFHAYNDPVTGAPTGNYFVATASLAGDLIYDPQMHSQLPPDEIEKCVLAPSDTRVHVLHMENILADISLSSIPRKNEEPFRIERVFEICDTSTPPKCERSFLSSPIPANASNTFHSRSYYSPQVSAGARLYPPMGDPPGDEQSDESRNHWIEKFSTRRYAFAALHRFRNYVGPDYFDVRRFLIGVPPVIPAERAAFANKASLASGTTRTADFYFVTLKRPQSTSRYVRQSSDPGSLPGLDRSIPYIPAALPTEADLALPVAWRVQVEFPRNYVSPATGIPTEVQVPPTLAGADEQQSLMLAGMFPTGAYFVDEITGLVYRVTRRRVNSNNVALLTLDREVLLRDVDDSDVDQFPIPNGAVDEHETLRTVWVFPPPISERIGDTIVFDDSSPVVGIDIRTMSLTPPG